MRNRLFILPIVLCAATLLLFPSGLADNGSLSGDDSPQITQKSREDYMSTLLERNTNPLGLKDDITLQRYLSQPEIKWAIRAGRRHLLN
ncbi:MAG: hypothetical protein MUP70_07415 [Candidatus Aminicenantes bacterium]|nr:hypothetical protein [Candidatus Aminicenantes bacterium]